MFLSNYELRVFWWQNDRILLFRLNFRLNLPPTRITSSSSKKGRNAASLLPFVSSSSLWRSENSLENSWRCTILTSVFSDLSSSPAVTGPVTRLPVVLFVTKWKQYATTLCSLSYEEYLRLSLDLPALLLLPQFSTPAFGFLCLCLDAAIDFFRRSTVPSKLFSNQFGDLISLEHICGVVMRWHMKHVASTVRFCIVDTRFATNVFRVFGSNRIQHNTIVESFHRYVLLIFVP